MDKKRAHEVDAEVMPEPQRKSRKTAGIDVKSFQLSYEQLRVHKFPLNDNRSHSGWITLDQHVKLPDTHDIMAIDCEMCVTIGPYKELARVVVLDSEGAVVLDKLVKPQYRVTDYRTQYSGITEELLRDVKTTLADVQADLRRLISARTILVGHSLENDLRALKMVHSRVIDTSVLFFDRRKFPLRELARVHLKRTIQQADSHDPIEDARAALHLAYLRMGIPFADEVKSTVADAAPDPPPPAEPAPESREEPAKA
eukprot:TRINITY_DN24316_c0_g1_i1.p1 TRINITY_DN24316_c0_g1~~TRINITY_DN24316_c0_g1_i1.p1  ORF type:complete len:256 (+),score=69.48 TRINITY_DN24316_c0_g1_i1:266-1033(+)